MKANWAREIAGLAISLIAIGCGAGDMALGDFEHVVSALNGAVVATGGPLTRLTFQEANEQNRRQETKVYYQTVQIGITGTSGGTISANLDTLDKFKAFYKFGQGTCSDTATRRECAAYYYNRGDLGLGREMHCTDSTKLFGERQVACYVTNFAAGDDNSEFTFGLSSSTAFDNLHRQNDFATVAMVYRGRMSPGTANRVFFVVYDKDGLISDFAALDRHAISFATGAVGGTPGVNFNLHIPTNCTACHGGQRYNQTAHTQVDSLFLPFDLDQFEYEDVPGMRRADQLIAFKQLNQMVWRVAAGSPGAGDSIKSQLNTWYSNTRFASVYWDEVFENQFDSNAVPTGWTNEASFYQSVVRRSCRGCHMADQLSVQRRFDSDNDFLGNAILSVNRICTFEMPHALQVTREFWQSTAPSGLWAYLDRKGLTASRDHLLGCGPGNVVTLDPPPITMLFGASML